MRILLTADTLGGVWTYALELARALSEQGVQTALATMGASLSSSQRQEAACIPELRLFESDYKLEWMQEPWDDVRDAGQWLLDIERTFRPDVVHLSNLVHGALPWRAPTLNVVHSCVLSWWEAVKGCSAPESWDRYRDEVTEGLRTASVVVAPSRAMLQIALARYGPFSEARMIHNGRSPGAFLTPAVKEPLVLTAGRLWDEAKNVRALDAIAPTLSWPVYVAGEPEHPNGPEAQTSEMRRLGKLSSSELAIWYRRASIYALPARYEPFGLTALEAGLAGCALVLGDIASLREIWDGAARFVPPDDHDALAAVLQQLIDDSEERRKMGERARWRALHYSPLRMSDGYLSIYRRLSERLPSSAAAVELQPALH